MSSLFLKQLVVSVAMNDSADDDVDGDIDS